MKRYVETTDSIKVPRSLRERVVNEKSRRRPVWIAVAAAAAVIAIIVAIVLPGGGITPIAGAIYMAKYPEMSPYPENESQKAYEAWWEDIKAQRRPDGYADGLEDFFTTSIRELLSGAGDENAACSPLNIYMALGMLGELTDGETREQILELLGCGSIEELRRQAGDVWNATYLDDGATRSILASSLWLNEDVDFNADTLETLAKTYYASSFQGEMGSEELNGSLHQWLNEQTGGLLTDQVDNINLKADTILALAATVYFRAKWTPEFSESHTEPGTFHSPAVDITCEFMHQGGTDTYYWGEGFSAVSKYLESGGRMWFILPDEGVTPEELINSDEVMDFILSSDGRKNSKTLIVNKSIPKFDISSRTDLIESLAAMGITDVLNPDIADFSPMTDEDFTPGIDGQGIYLSQATHGVRVAIDEEGVTAAAYTVMATAEAGEPPEEEVDFILDRPFIFVITNPDGLPLFAGIVNEP